MKELNLKEIEFTFNELIKELAKIKSLNDLTEAHKKNTEDLIQKFLVYHNSLKERDAFLLTTSSSMKEKQTLILEKVEKQTKNTDSIVDSIIKARQENEEKQTFIIEEIEKQTKKVDSINNSIIKVQQENNDKFNHILNSLEQSIKNNDLKYSKLSGQINTILSKNKKSTILTIVTIVIALSILVFQIVQLIL